MQNTPQQKGESNKKHRKGAAQICIKPKKQTNAGGHYPTDSRGKTCGKRTASTAFSRVWSWLSSWKDNELLFSVYKNIEQNFWLRRLARWNQLLPLQAIWVCVCESVWCGSCCVCVCGRWKMNFKPAVHCCRQTRTSKYYFNQHPLGCDTKAPSCVFSE